MENRDNPGLVGLIAAIIAMTLIYGAALVILLPVYLVAWLVEWMENRVLRVFSKKRSAQ